MLTQEEKQEIRKKVDALQKDIKELREKLNDLNSQKEKIFQERSTLGKEISAKIGVIKGLRQKS